MSERLPQVLRSDAQDNRERILSAARAAFTEHGFQVPMREVADRAGVSPATVYRRFPTKAALAHEVYMDQARACRSIIAEGSADPDPWRGFRLVVEKIFDLHALDHGFTSAYMSAFPDALDYAADRRASFASVAQLARRAQATGRLRADFMVNDLVLVIMAHRGLRGVTEAARLSYSRRFAKLALRAFASA